MSARTYLILCILAYIAGLWFFSDYFLHLPQWARIGSFIPLLVVTVYTTLCELRK